MRSLLLLLLVGGGCGDPDPGTDVDDSEPVVDTDDTEDTDPVIDVVASAPGAATIRVDPARPRVLDGDLRCVVDRASVDPDGDDVTYEVRWLRDGAPFQGTTSGALTGDTIPEAAVSAGDRFTCEVVPVDTDGFRGPTATTSAVVAIPSVLLLIADDVGIGELGVDGGSVPTPSLDALADEGVRFEAAYASAPVCGPSRAGLLTGRYQDRFGFEFNVGSPAISIAEGRGLPIEELTVGDLLGSAGLATTYVGKWHVGPLAQHHPLARGFDAFFGLLGGQRWQLRPGEEGVIDVWPDALEEPLPAWPYGNAAEAITDQGVIVDLDPRRHLTDVLADEAIARIDPGGDPFLLVVSFTAAHEPFQGVPEHVALLTDPSPDPDRRAYEATLAGMDAAIGRILARLQEAGRADDTLVVFVSDHGCNELLGVCDNAPASGGKLRMSEGGLRVPMIARWPDRLAAGTIFAPPTSTLDLVPTLARATGAVLPSDRDYDGVDLLPFLRHEATGTPHPVLAWRMGDAHAIRVGDDKAVTTAGHTWLFDLGADPSETTDRSGADPATIDQLASTYAQVRASFVDPLWEGHAAEVTLYGLDLDVEF